MDINKLLSLQTSKHGHVRHMCIRCLNTLKSERLLISEHEYCKSYEAIKIELPEDGSKISFKNHNSSMRVPFIVYTQILHPSHHNYQHTNQTMRRGTSISIRNTSPVNFVIS